eukprot:1476128-Amphidinium_carterae.1
MLYALSHHRTEDSRDHPDLFVHAEYFKDLDERYEAKNKGLHRGDKISFDIEKPQKGKKSAQAVNVKFLRKTKRNSPSRSPSGRKSRPPPKDTANVRA